MHLCVLPVVRTTGCAYYRCCLWQADSGWIPEPGKGVSVTDRKSHFITEKRHRMSCIGQPVTLSCCLHTGRSREVVSQTGILGFPEKAAPRAEILAGISVLRAGLSVHLREQDASADSWGLSAPGLAGDSRGIGFASIL